MQHFLIEERLTDFYVGLTNTDPKKTKPVVGKYDVCAQYKGHPDAGETVSLKCGAKKNCGRYLIVQLPKDEYLTLCEVEVYPVSCPGLNLLVLIH